MLDQPADGEGADGVGLAGLGVGQGVGDARKASCLLEAGGSLYGLAFHLCWLGFDIEVLEPPELRTVLAELAAKMARAASSGEGL